MAGSMNGNIDDTTNGNDVNPTAGSTIVGANALLTAVFVVSAVISTVIFDQPWKAVAVAVAIAAFSVGVVAFLWGYFAAVQRSRRDDIAVAALYFLVDGVAPRSIARVMNGLLTVQVTVGLVTAIVRGSTDGEPGSTLAFGILVPMLGLGLNGLWGALHGTFRPRATEVHGGDPPNGQDESHD
ncbi:MAG: hypothetical protein ACKOCC_09285 [Actinomycetota bacterium]